MTLDGCMLGGRRVPPNIAKPRTTNQTVISFIILFRILFLTGSMIDISNTLSDSQLLRWVEIYYLDPRYIFMYPNDN